MAWVEWNTVLLFSPLTSFSETAGNKCVTLRPRHGSKGNLRSLSNHPLERKRDRGHWFHTFFFVCPRLTYSHLPNGSAHLTKLKASRTRRRPPVVRVRLRPSGPILSRVLWFKAQMVMLSWGDSESPLCHSFCAKKVLHDLELYSRNLFTLIADSLDKWECSRTRDIVLFFNSRHCSVLAKPGAYITHNATCLPTVWLEVCVCQM